MYGSQQTQNSIEQQIQDLMAFKHRLTKDLSEVDSFSGIIKMFSKYRNEVTGNPDLILKHDYLKEIDDSRKKIAEGYIAKADAKIKELIKQLPKEPAA